MWLKLSMGRMFHSELGLEVKWAIYDNATEHASTVVNLIGAWKFYLTLKCVQNLCSLGVGKSGLLGRSFL